ncbi:hypothetical protein V6C03_12755 [Methyloligella sp. 2.7D]|uniref:hypothetical protein n=1 Tax=unclassified Methyloligella TaxID=2625955 RepID=UPI00157DF823|nr:hypothetical protein [Methyloligella sp. GL2]QKP77348.1 hypothetical protein HT051_07705 [Methyloligella sp. GL2]
MLRTVMRLVSGLEIGARIKAKADAIKRQTFVVVVALIFLLLALIFGLLAGYNALISVCEFTPLAAAGLVAGSLLAIGVLLLLLLPAFGEKKRKPEPQAAIEAGTEGLAMLDESLNKAMRQTSPITLLAVAFIAGLLASRRR